MFKPNAKKDRDAIEYNGPRDAKGIEDAVRKRIG